MIAWLGLLFFCEIVLHQKYLLLNSIPLAADVFVVSDVIMIFCLFPVVGLTRLEVVVDVVAFILVCFSSLSLFLFRFFLRLLDVSFASFFV